MTVDGALELLRNAIIVAAELSGPVILVALIVGIGIGVLQTVVQVNEASLSFVIKLLAVCLCIAVLGPRLLTRSVDYTRTTIGRISEVVR
jgi:flagellar biosynthetic protein FliQ